MSNTDLDALKTEVSHLHKLVAILVDQLWSLKNEIDHLKNPDSIKPSPHSQEETAKRGKSDVYTIDKIGDMIKSLFNTNDNFRDMLRTDVYTKDNFSNMIRSDDYTKDIFRHMASSGNYTKDNFGDMMSNAATDDAKKQGMAPTGNIASSEKAVPVIKFETQYINTLAGALRKFMPVRASREKAGNVARQLLYLYVHGKATGNKLRMIAGLSKPGYAKHLPTLRRGNWIVRKEKLNYVLTEQSKKIIAKTFGIPYDTINPA